MADKITKLSQAIRLGATFRPQCHFDVFRRGGSCALGAAYEVVTGIGNEVDYTHGPGFFKAMGERFGYERDEWDRIVDRVVAWNDGDQLSREEIAQKLELQGL